MVTETVFAPPQCASPLAQTFAQVRSVNAYLQVHLGAQPSLESWPLRTLIETDHPALDEHLAIMAREYQTNDRDVLVRFYFNSFAYALASAAVGAFMAQRRVPILDVNALSLTLGSWGGPEAIVLGDTRFHCLPDDPAAAHDDALPVANREALRDLLRDGLIAAYGPMIAALRTRGRVGARALWIAAAETCASILIDALPGGATEMDAQGEVQALIGDTRSTLRAKPEILTLRAGGKSGLVLLGHDCCCNFKITGQEYCDSCPHRPRAERLAALQKWMAERAE